MLFNKVIDWAQDYFYFAKGHSLMFVKPPQNYSGASDKAPIILIPGVHTKWQFLKAVADQVSLQGHPIYTVDNLGFNIKAIDESAKLVRVLIDEKKLDNVIILAHSKGGLIAKYLLAFENQDNRVKKAIAIASPFHGSNSVKYLLNKEHKELGPDSPMIAKLNSQKAVNDKIVSVFCRHDNHVWPTESCRLEGAKNIQVDVFDHHKILYDKKVHDIVLEEINK